MPNATVKIIQDRLYTINQTLGTPKAERYFVPSGQLANAKLPLIFSLPGPDRALTNRGASEDLRIETYTLVIVCWAWLASMPTISAINIAEEAIDTVRDAYLSRANLQFNGAMLPGVIGCAVGNHSGIVPLRYDANYASVEIPLLIETNKVVLPNFNQES
ncbi:MAG: hypothetical protein CL610_06065 [Anaerolineaceae bacterium]|nr:hypothetical protein [Anaerolineaceae bacterium]